MILVNTTISTFFVMFCLLLFVSRGPNIKTKYHIKSINFELLAYNTINMCYQKNNMNFENFFLYHLLLLLNLQMLTLPLNDFCLFGVIMAKL